MVKYHYLSFGWLVEGLVYKITGVSVQEYIKRNVAEKLSISDEFMIGLAEGSDLPSATLVLALNPLNNKPTVCTLLTNNYNIYLHFII